MLWILVIVGALQQIVQTSVADPRRPRTRYAAEDGMAVWSSPEEGRYPVGRLPRGAPVAVYQQRDGWLAIRPPEGCFSWVRSDLVQPSDDPSIVITRVDGVRSWIGGESPSAAPEHPQTQVQLDLGESLRKLGQWELTAPSGKVLETWYRIAPPAGEFRWVRVDQTRSAPPRETATTASQGPGGDSFSPSADHDASSQRTGNPADADQGDLPLERSVAPPESVPLDSLPPDGAGADPPDLPTAPPGSAWRARGVVREPADPTGGGTPWEPSGNAPGPSDAPHSPNPADSLDATALTPTVLASARQRLAARGVNFEQQLSDLELRFSTMAAKAPDRWEFAALVAEATVLAGDGQDALQRGRARKVLEELRAFEDLRRRYALLDDGVLVDEALAEKARIPIAEDSVEPGLPESDQRSPEEVLEGIRDAVSRIRRTVAQRNDPVQRVGDLNPPEAVQGNEGLGVPQPVEQLEEQAGWLLPVRSKKADAPPYALIDRDGEVICFVDLDADADLSRLLKSRVIVRGRRRYVPHLRRDVFTAQEVRAPDRQ